MGIFNCKFCKPSIIPVERTEILQRSNFCFKMRLKGISQVASFIYSHLQRLSCWSFSSVSVTSDHTGMKWCPAGHYAALQRSIMKLFDWLFLNALFIYLQILCASVWQLTSGGKLTHNYSYPSTDYKWCIAHLKWWIGDLYLSSLFRHHQNIHQATILSPDRLKLWCFTAIKALTEPLLLSAPVNDRRERH